MVASVGLPPGSPNPLNYLFHGEMHLVIGRAPQFDLRDVEEEERFIYTVLGHLIFVSSLYGL